MIEFKAAGFTRSHERRRRLSVVMARFGAALAVITAFTAASQAQAQVLQIGAEGSVTVYDGPAVFTADGARSIVARASGPVHASRKSWLTSPELKLALGEAAAAHQLSPDLVEAVAWRESGLRAAAVSRAGALGVMQLMPATARDLGVDPSDPRQNIGGGAAYLKAMLSRFGGDLSLGLAAYNAGPGAVMRYGGVPPYAETRRYVAAVMERMAAQAAAPGR